MDISNHGSQQVVLSPRTHLRLSAPPTPLANHHHHHPPPTLIISMKNGNFLLPWRQTVKTRTLTNTHHPSRLDVVKLSPMSSEPCGPFIKTNCTGFCIIKISLTRLIFGSHVWTIKGSKIWNVHILVSRMSTLLNLALA